MTQLFSVESDTHFLLKRETVERGFFFPCLAENSGRKNIWEELFSEAL